MATGVAEAGGKPPAALVWLCRIPVLGWFLRDALLGPPDAKYYFIANGVMAWIFAAACFGFAGLIIPALALTPVVLTTIVVMTRG